MISGRDIYDVLAALVPLYVAMVLAYGSVRWWKIFTPDQCSGINRFVAVFAVPLLSFHFISSNNPYAMNYLFLAADSLQKVVVLAALFLWHALSKNSSLEWVITLFSLSTLPNTLVMGIPLLKSMYGDFSANLMVQIVVLQSVIWYTLLLFMFEYRGAKLLIAQQFPDTGGSISSFRVESDVISLGGREPLQADPEIRGDGKLHVVLRRSTSSSVISLHNRSHAFNPTTPRASNLTGVEIFSVQSSGEPTPRPSTVSQTDFYAMFASKAASPKHGYRNSFGGGVNVAGDVYSLKSSKGPTPSTSNFEEEMMRIGMKRGSKSMSGDLFNDSGLISSCPPPNPLFSRSTNSANAMSNRGLHMFVWSSSNASPVSEGNRRHPASRATSAEFGVVDSSSALLLGEISTASKGTKIDGDREILIEDGSGSSLTCQEEQVGMEGDHVEKKPQMPPASVVTGLILIMVWRKLIRNPNTYASLAGLIWSLISFRWNIQMPSIVKGSISILSDTGLGMAMFSLGLFMALQPKIIACGKSVATFSMAVRFLAGPAVIAATSAAIGIRGVLLQVAIVQAALPQGIVPFVFAKEYNVHASILSTAVIFGMLVALPIAILYYVLLGL